LNKLLKNPCADVSVFERNLLPDREKNLFEKSVVNFRLGRRRRATHVAEPQRDLGRIVVTRAGNRAQQHFATGWSFGIISLWELERPTARASPRIVIHYNALRSPPTAAEHGEEDPREIQMDTAADHVFHSESASQALLNAMKQLAEASQRSLKELEGITLGAAFDLAVETYGADLPEFWVIWNEWNLALEEPPAEMGDL
jgi:hypothetical protein